MDELDVDYLSTKDGAEMLAEVIRKYWQMRGRYPKVWVDRLGSKATGDGVVWQVRSDMIGGMPRG